MTLEPLINVDASLRVFTEGPWPLPGTGMLKTRQDLDRYEQVIEATRPDVIVECGTWTGESARWLASFATGAVITVDLNPVDFHDWPTIWTITGSSTDPVVVADVAHLVAGRRTMAVLDSDHSAAHVAREIELYGPLVTSDCYLVVEDGIIRYMPDALRQRHVPGIVGDPLNAVEKLLAGNPDWARDTEVEAKFPVSHHPAGWWQRAP